MYRDGTLPRLRNVQGRNITKVKECTGILCTLVHLVVLPTLENGKMKGEIQFWGQTITQTHNHT